MSRRSTLFMFGLCFSSVCFCHGSSWSQRLWLTKLAFLFILSDFSLSLSFCLFFGLCVCVKFLQSCTDVLYTRHADDVHYVASVIFCCCLVWPATKGLDSDLRLHHHQHKHAHTTVVESVSRTVGRLRASMGKGRHKAPCRWRSLPSHSPVIAVERTVHPSHSSFLLWEGC